MKSGKILILCLLVFALGACSYQQNRLATERHGQRGSLKPGADYVVRRGDTLFGIAWRHGLDMGDLARWNGISDPNRIRVGQRLRTTPGGSRGPIARSAGKTSADRTSSAPAASAPPVSSAGQPGWVWPTRGNVVQNYDPAQPGRQGLRFGGSRGQSVNAAAAGEVAYTGTGLSGFGRMVIVRHGNGVLSAYGYLDSVAVGEGQKVGAGQNIGTMGIGAQNRPTLHFETRKQGQPVNPYSYIGTTARY